MVAESTGDERSAVCDCDVEIVRLGGWAEKFVLDGDDGRNGLLQSFLNFCSAMVLFPRKWHSSVVLTVWLFSVAGSAKEGDE